MQPKKKPKLDQEAKKKQREAIKKYLQRMDNFRELLRGGKPTGKPPVKPAGRPGRSDLWMQSPTIPLPGGFQMGGSLFMKPANPKKIDGVLELFTPDPRFKIIMGAQIDTKGGNPGFGIAVEYNYKNFWEFFSKKKNSKK